MWSRVVPFSPTSPNPLLHKNSEYSSVLTSSKKLCVFLRMCFSSVSSRQLRFSASALALTSFISFSNFSKVAYKASYHRKTFELNLELQAIKNITKFSLKLLSKCTSRSIISLGAGASGLSPVSNIGMPSFLISFSKKPGKMGKHISVGGTQHFGSHSDMLFIFTTANL